MPFFAWEDYGSLPTTRAGGVMTNSRHEKIGAGTGEAYPTQRRAARDQPLYPAPRHIVRRDALSPLSFFMRAPIELPRKIEFECQEISEKAGTWSHAIALLDLYSISRAEFEDPTTFAGARSTEHEQDCGGASGDSETVVSRPKNRRLTPSKWRSQSV